MRKIRYWMRIGLLPVLVFYFSNSLAENLLMTRSKLEFPETMLAVQGLIADYGYTVSRVQRIDIGLTKSHYKTDKYRVVFFGKAEEIKQLTAKYPGLIPYLPLQVVLFAEENQTVVSSLNPSQLSHVVNADPALQVQFKRWESDLRSLFKEIRELNE